MCLNFAISMRNILYQFAPLLEGTDPITADEVREHLVNELSEGHRPRDVFFVDEFPRNPMGKVIRKKLPGRSTVE